MDILKSILVWLIGITFIVIFFPVTFLIWFISLPFDRNRIAVHNMLVFQSLLVSHIIPVWSLRIEGRDKAVKGTTYVIISNHQSILDILLINCLRYRFRWVSKIENIKLPLIGWYLKMADYLTVDRGNKESKGKLIEEALGCLERNISIMLFPEGTRSVDGQIGFFKRGAFQLAILAEKPILPVIIDGSGGVLPKHGLVFGGFHKIVVRVLDPVSFGRFGTKDWDVLALKFQTMMTEELRKLREENTT